MKLKLINVQLEIKLTELIANSLWIHSYENICADMYNALYHKTSEATNVLWGVGFQLKLQLSEQL